MKACVFAWPGSLAGWRLENAFPLPTGLGQWFNYARPSIWAVGGAVTLMTIARLVATMGFLTRRF